jgi:hypothetical protein
MSRTRTYPIANAPLPEGVRSDVRFAFVVGGATTSAARAMDRCSMPRRTSSCRDHPETAGTRSRPGTLSPGLRTAHLPTGLTNAPAPSRKRTARKRGSAGNREPMVSRYTRAGVPSANRSTRPTFPTREPYVPAPQHADARGEATRNGTPYGAPVHWTVRHRLSPGFGPQCRDTAGISQCIVEGAGAGRVEGSGCDTRHADDAGVTAVADRHRRGRRHWPWKCPRVITRGARPRASGGVCGGAEAV